MELFNGEQQALTMTESNLILMRKKPDALLDTFNAFVVELTKRKRRWSPAERDLYNAVVRSLGKSAQRMAAARTGRSR